MKYGEVVRDLPTREGYWRFYDTQFRNLLQTNPSEMPWGSTHWELWIRAQNFNNSRFQSKSQPIRNNFTNAVAGPFVPRGFCRKFHRGTECQGCNFQHKCFKCGVVNPAVRCNFRPSRAAFLTPPRPPPNPALPTPVHIEKLRPLLCGYDVALTSMLYYGFKYGFPLHFKGARSSFFVNNLVSAQQNPEIVSAKLFKECQANRLAGPFDHPPLVNFRVSPLGVVPKKAPGEYRLIHHLSFPSGDSVNDGIDPEHTSVSYARVDDAVTMIKRLRRGSFLAKTDIKSAFRIIPIRPSDYDLLGIFWQGKFYYDRAMPIGCASSCRTFEMFSTALVRVAKKHLMIPHLIHILDDYLMAASTYHQYRINLVRFLSLCKYLGVPMARKKLWAHKTFFRLPELN